MIISHTHKFIFIKSQKTAGTSIEAALSNYCGGDDVVTPINDYPHNRDENGEFIHRSMNAEQFRDVGQHVDALRIRNSLRPEMWAAYFKFSIARNPWDRAVSYFYWERRRDPGLKAGKRFYHYLGVPFDERRHLQTLFLEFVRSADPSNTDNDRYTNNDRFYILGNELCVDFIIRYEHLNEDVNQMCERIGIPRMSIPHLKAGIRRGQRHYSEHYNDESREIVREQHRNDIRFFGYEFEEA